MTTLVHRTGNGVVREARVVRPSPPAPLPGGEGSTAPTVIPGGRAATAENPRMPRDRIGIFWSYLCGGGVETVNRDIADALPKDKYIVDAFVWGADDLFLGLAASFDELVVLNQPFEPIGQPGRGPFPPIEQCAGFQRLLLERHYDLFIMSCCWAPFWLVHMHGIPIIEYWHGFGCWNGFDMPSQAIVAVSETTRQQIEAIRPQHAPVTVIHNAVDPERYAHVSDQRAEARARFGLQPNAPVVLYCGRFSGEKRPDDAMRAFVEARKKQPDLQLLMVGICNNTYYFVKMGEEIGLRWGVDAWHYVLSHDEIGLAYAAADVLLHPSEWEGLGMVLLEALAAGLPVISTCAGGCSELVEGVAIKVGVGDTQAMAKAINKVLGSAKLREKMKLAGQARVRDGFGLQEQGQKLERVIEGVLGSRS